MGARRGTCLVLFSTSSPSGMRFCFLGLEPNSAGLLSTRLCAALGGSSAVRGSRCSEILPLSRALESRQMEFSNPAISRSNKSSANPNPQVFTRQTETVGALCRWCYSCPVAGETEAGSRETAHSRLGNKPEEEVGKFSSLPSTYLVNNNSPQTCWGQNLHLLPQK